MAEVGKSIVFHSYTTRFLLKVAQLELTVSASPVGPNTPTSEDPQDVMVQFKNYVEETELEVDTDVVELEALGRALVSCAQAISLTPEQQFAHLRHHYEEEEQE